MNRTIQTQSRLRTAILALCAFSTFALFVIFMTNTVQAAMSRTLDLGSSGSDVTELQTYLSKDSSLYPSGLITGYYGPLTAAAIQRFQTAQGIISNGTPATTGYGRVGPQTLARLNSLMTGGNQTSWDPVPVLSTPIVQSSNRSAVISWTTNEPTEGQVYYDTAPLIAYEATGPMQQPYVSGLNLTEDGYRTSHAITIQNLQPNTSYSYLIRGVDSARNLSMTLPNTFRTTN